MPKISGVVHIGQMAQLVDNHIIRDCGRCQHESPVKREGASCTAASPAGLLIPDGDAVVGAAGKLHKVSGTFGKILFCSGDIPLFQSDPLDIGQVGDRAVLALFFCLQIFGDDPDTLLHEKTINLFLGDVKRDADCNLSFRIDADCTAFAAAADKCVGQFIEFALILNSDGIFGVIVHWVSCKSSICVNRVLSSYD